jgi:hypothetical protein
MALFKTFFKPPASAAPPPPQVAPVPAHLPKITAPTAAHIAKHSDPSPAAKALLTPQQTPPQYLSALQDKHLGNDMVKTMAHGMPDREGVHWASQSAQNVSDKLPAHDVTAMKAAQAWVKNPTPANQAAAGAAAAKANHSGPGALAAQGAAWAQPAHPAAGAAGAAAAPRLTPHAVSGAVLMAAAIKANPAVAAPTLAAPALKAPQAPTLAAPSLQAPKAQIPGAAPQAPAEVPPEVQAHTFKQQHPFIAMGLDIASGKNTPA